MAENDFEKTEAPTQRRLQDARNDGNVARSTDLSAALALLAAIVLLDLFGMRVLGGMKVAIEMLLTSAHASNPTRANDLYELTGFGLNITTSILMPVVLGIMLVATLATLGQVGFLLTAKPLTPSFTKLSPIKGVKNLVNLRAGVRLLMSLAKIGIIAAIATYFILNDLPTILHIGELTTAQAIYAIGHLSYVLALKLAAVLLILAILDYAYQKYQRTADLKMSKHDVKEEMKRMEGDPLVKQRRARVARQLAMQRIAAAVPTADVIVTNPTHFAVALKYDGDSMSAPKVVAKGADLMAMRIRQIAAGHEIPIVERPPLARALYRTVEIGEEVPAEHYAAVAEILAFVYRVAGNPEYAAA